MPKSTWSNWKKTLFGGSRSKYAFRTVLDPDRIWMGNKILNLALCGKRFLKVYTVRCKLRWQQAIAKTWSFNAMYNVFTEHCAPWTPLQPKWPLAVHALVLAESPMDMVKTSTNPKSANPRSATHALRALTLLSRCLMLALFEETSAIAHEPFWDKNKEGGTKDTM